MLFIVSTSLPLCACSCSITRMEKNTINHSAYVNLVSSAHDHLSSSKHHCEKWKRFLSSAMSFFQEQGQSADPAPVALLDPVIASISLNTPHSLSPPPLLLISDGK